MCHNKPIDTQIVDKLYYARFSSCKYDKVMTKWGIYYRAITIFPIIPDRGHISGGIRAGGVTPKTIRKTKKATIPVPLQFCNHIVTKLRCSSNFLLEHYWNTNWNTLKPLVLLCFLLKCSSVPIK